MDKLPTVTLTLVLTPMERATILAALEMHAVRTSMEKHVRPIIQQINAPLPLNPPELWRQV